MKLMRFEGTNKLAYKAVRVKEAQKYGSRPLWQVLLTFLTSHSMGLLGDDVQMVLARIEEAGNEGQQYRVSFVAPKSTHPSTIGIWTKTIQRKTELPQTVVNKCIKTLESQGIIKNIKAVKVCVPKTTAYRLGTMMITKDSS